MKVIDFKDFPDTSTPICAELLNEMQELLFKAIYPVGSYYETSDKNFDPNVSFGGTWVLDNDGTVLASRSLETDSLLNEDLGSILGEEKHVLTIEEMPKHYHDKILSNDSSQVLYSGEDIATENNKMGVKNNSGSSSDVYKEPLYTSFSGGDQAHSIIQPTKIVNRWYREA